MSAVDVFWLPRAIEPLLSIIDHVSADSPSAAVDLAVTIRAAADTLATTRTVIEPGASRARVSSS